jgi:single-strand DNA-binding protein
MAKGINRVILIGNIGNDPVLSTTNGGGSVVSLSLATSESWKDKKTGDNQERTEWHRLVFFGKVADIVAQYTKKGSKVYVEGSLRTREWVDKEQIKRYTTEIVCSQFQIIDGMSRDTPAQSKQADQMFDDDIQF